MFKLKGGALIAGTAAVCLLTTGPVFGAVDKCQKRVEGEADKFQNALFKALALCKDSIRKEKVKAFAAANAAGGVFTDCNTAKASVTNTNGHGAAVGCMATAAKFCETQLFNVYGLKSDGTVDPKKKAGLYRAAIVKARTPNAKGIKECEDSDLGVDLTFSGRGLGHLLSGATGTKGCLGGKTPGKTCTTSVPDCGDGLTPATTGTCVSVGGAGLAPPAAPGDAGKFFIDWSIIGMEKLAIKQQLYLIPDFLAMMSDAVDADPGKTTDVGPAPASKQGTTCDGPVGGQTFDAANYDYRPNLCRFGVECRDHACVMDTSAECEDAAPGDNQVSCTLSGVNPQCADANGCNPIASALNAVVNFPPEPQTLAVPILNAQSMELCRMGRGSGKCAIGGTNCDADGDCTGVGNKCNLFPGEGLGFTFGTEGNFATSTPAVLYLINEPARTLQAPVPPVPAFASAINAACVNIVRSEGWCDCVGGQAASKNVVVCQDRLSPSSGTDDCGAPANVGTKEDSTFAGSFNGPLTLSTSTASTAGDCVDMVSLSFSLLEAPACTTNADCDCGGACVVGLTGQACTVGNKKTFGPDCVPCTLDDFAAPTAPVAVPVTTGSATATIKNIPDAGAPGGGIGTCSITVATQCLEDANCPDGETCTGETLTDLTLLATGAKTSCAQYLTSNLSGVKFVGGVGAVNALLGVDALTTFNFVCK